MSFQIRPQLHDQLHEKLRHRPHRVAGIVANVAAGLVAGLVMGAAASTATADVLTTPPAPSASEQANRPTRGMSMEKVEALFGAPVRRQPAVGEPPITRWQTSQPRRPAQTSQPRRPNPDVPARTSRPRHPGQRSSQTSTAHRDRVVDPVIASLLPDSASIGARSRVPLW